jgi:hypothetical protein
MFHGHISDVLKTFKRKTPEPFGPRVFSFLKKLLLGDLGNGTGTYGAATFADREAQTFFHSDWLN